MSNEVEVAEVEVVTPKVGDIGWTPYVLGLLREDEVVEGCPKVDGLRRVIEIALGKVVTSKSKVVSTFAGNGNNLVSVVEHELEIRIGDCQKGNYTYLRYSGCADAGDHNTKSPYNKYATAMAETRAEGRALRKALRLNVAVAEEMEDKSFISVNDEEKGLSVSKIKILNMMCRRLNIDTRNFINKTLNSDYNSIVGVYDKDHQLLVDTLNKYTQDMSSIPEEIKTVTYSVDFE